MQKIVTNKLREIEKENDICILLAVESGSRAWGLASPDSDYDVRFLYVRPKKDYLRLEQTKDVIELPISNNLDISGWDLQKALRLLYKSNPTLFEWLSSPIVYKETAFAIWCRKVAQEYFSPKKCIFHYYGMAKKNYHSFLEQDMVRVKKYFYVLRPVLACQWILEKKTPPPVLFSDLSTAMLPQELQHDVDVLLDLKMCSPEIKEIPKVQTINDFLLASLDDIDASAKKLNDVTHNWDYLNLMFLKVLEAQSPV